jgi:membrane-bound metal-dependent hydrolase YbcI (DUF457 family)
MHEPAAPLALFASLTAAYALAPDLDSCSGTEARSFGFVTEAFAWLVRLVSGGHRHGTHSAVGVAAFTAVAWLACLSRQTWPGRIALGVILAVGLTSAMDALRVGGHAGNLLGCAGDMLTVSGCPLLWPGTMREYHLLPGGLRFTTGKMAEHWVVTPLLMAALAFLAWRDASGQVAILHAHLTGGITT